MTVSAGTRRALHERAGAEPGEYGLCERCGQRRATNAHHRRNRSQGGGGELSNLLLLCGSGTTGCHGYVTEHPRDALAQGWLLPHGANPAREPVWYRGAGWVLLDDLGGINPVLEGSA